MTKKVKTPKNADAAPPPSVSMLMEKAEASVQTTEQALKKLRVSLRSPKQGADSPPAHAEAEKALITRLKRLKGERKALLKKMGRYR